MWLERGQGLCRCSQHCQTRRRLPQTLSGDWTYLPSFHDRDAHGHELGVVYRFRAGATVAANVPSGPPPRRRKDLHQRLDQICYPAFRFVPRHRVSLVRITGPCDSLIKLDILLSNGTTSRYVPPTTSRSLMLMRQMPPGCALSVARMPSQRTIFAGSVKNENTVSGRAAI